MKLGKFGHHPDPAIDFCIEVECLEGMAVNRKVGFAAEADFDRRLEVALAFRVGGDSGAVAAKQKLRKLQPMTPSEKPPTSAERDPFNEGKFEDEAKEVYCWGNPRIWDIYVRGAKSGFSEGRRVQAAQVAEAVERLEHARLCFIAGEVKSAQMKCSEALALLRQEGKK